MWPTDQENRSPGPALDADSARLAHSALYRSTPGSASSALRPHSWALLPLFRDALWQSLVAAKHADRFCPYQNAPREHSAHRAAIPVGTPVWLSRPGPSASHRRQHAYMHWPPAAAAAHPGEHTAGLFPWSESPLHTVWLSAAAGPASYTPPCCLLQDVTPPAAPGWPGAACSLVRRARRHPSAVRSW